LALAGGAALGEAHIGILQWFEEHRIPVDRIAGTSMGGLVAACYSTGMSPDEMKELLSSVDWEQALSGTAAYRALPFRRKEDRRDFPNRIEIGLKDGFRLPAGLNPALAIGLVLSRIAYPYSMVRHFDDLPIPFRCVATNLETGEAVTMSDGSLVTALRATMAIPGAFTPVVRDGKLLADGGILNNIPTQAVKDLGADVIIAVNLRPLTVSRQHLKTLPQILQRTLDISLGSNEKISLEQANVTITPEMSGIGINDFFRVDDSAQRGYDAAEKMAPQLLKYQLSEAEWQAYKAGLDARRTPSPPAPAFVRVEGAGNSLTRSLTREMSAYLGKTVPTEEFEATLADVVSDERVESVLYEAVRNDRGQIGILLRIVEKDYGPPFLRLGLGINGSETRAVQVSLAGRYVGLNVGGGGDEWRGDLRVGSDALASLEYYRPVGNQFFVAPRVFYSDTTRFAYTNDIQVPFPLRERGIALDIGRIPNRSTEWRLGWRQSYVEAGVPGPDDQPVAVPMPSGKVEQITMRYVRDGQDDPVIPNRGTRLQINGAWVYTAPAASEAFPLLEGRVSSFTPTSRRMTLFGTASAGTMFGYDTPPAFQFTLGGPLRLGGYDIDQLRGTSYFLLSSGVLTRLATLPPQIAGRVLGGAWVEVGGVSGGLQGSDTRGSISFGVLAETIIGPVLLGFSISEGWRRTPYFALGRQF
jgi:NTE family protein